MSKLGNSEYIKTVVGNEISAELNKLSADELQQLSNVIRRPDVLVRLNKTIKPNGIILTTGFGNIYTNGDLKSIDKVYVNGVEFGTKSNGLDALETLVSGYDGVSELLERKGNKRRRSGRRGRGRSIEDSDLERLKNDTYEDLKLTGVNYENLFAELGPLLQVRNISINSIADELFSNKISNEDIPRFLAYDSQYSRDIISQVQGIPLSSFGQEYNFEPVEADDTTFLGQLMTSLGETSGEYDKDNGVLKLGDRHILNLPNVDENGIFSNGDKRYIPYHIGYFADGEGTRVERLRHIDPVKNAIDSLKLHYELTPGDIKFKTILDVTRNLTDFENHPEGHRILDTLKRKLVIDKAYAKTNNLAAELNDKTDDLGNVAMTMLDDDAKYLIDPYGTSNGVNLGMIMYLTSDATFNPDGTLSHGTKEHSLVGEYMTKFHTEYDNFNRNQMSFNAFLTSTDIQVLKLAVSEVAMLNSDDALVLTLKGAKKFENENAPRKYTGDKLMEAHGDKGVTSVVLDPDMDPELIKERKLEKAIELAKLNPDIDGFISPISIVSRMNFGVVHEALDGEKSDFVKLNGEVVKDGVIELTYMGLPQTAEHKSKDYSKEGDGRRYSTLFRYGLQSKIGEELYRKGFIDQDIRDANLDKVVTNFQRLGLSFTDESKLIEPNNVNRYVDSKATIDVNDLYMISPSEIRKVLMDRMIDGQINIMLPSNMAVHSPMLGDNEIITDGLGRAILPIRVPLEVREIYVNDEGEQVYPNIAKSSHSNDDFSSFTDFGNIPIEYMESTDDTIEQSPDESDYHIEKIKEYGSIPYRYLDVFKALAVGNAEDLQKAYNKATGIDYNQLSRKDNIIKDIDTMKINDGAATLVIVPDPSLKLGDIRCDGFVDGDDNRAMIHRDPIFQSGNVMTVENVGQSDHKVLHINPLVMRMINGDFDGDTMGKRNIRDLTLSEDDKDTVSILSSVYEQLNYYGEVFLNTDSSHFIACTKAADIDISQINFDDGKTNSRLGVLVEDIQDKIMRSDDAYGAYAISFENEETVLRDLIKIADDGIKGNADDIRHQFEKPYTIDQNRKVSEALQAKDSLTPSAGMIINNFIADTSRGAFNADLIRVGLDIAQTQPQAVLQMKKNADKLYEIDAGIRSMKAVFSGRYDAHESSEHLKSITAGHIPPAAVDKFVEEVVNNQIPSDKFGQGILNSSSLSTTKLAYTSDATFAQAVKNISKQTQYDKISHDNVLPF